MKVLLDTAPFLWLISGERERLSPKTRACVEDADTECHISAVSTWEISIKAAIGKLEIKPRFDRWLPELVQEMGLRVLPISMSHTLAVSKLPLLHKDPFDRLLIAQAQLESLTILTPDKLFKPYRVSVLW